MKIIIIIFALFVCFSSLFCQSNADQNYNSGLKLRSSGNYQDAINNFNKTLELYPDSLNESCSLWIEKGGWYLGNCEAKGCLISSV